MPHEGLAAKLAAKRSGGRLNSLLEDAALAGGAGAAGVDAPFRARLHSLFAQIEKEFEQLYAENLGLQDKLEAATQQQQQQQHHQQQSAAAQLHAQSQSHHDVPTSAAAPAAASYHRYAAPEFFDADVGAAAKGLKAKLPAASSAVQQSSTSQPTAAAATPGSAVKLKASHKLRAQTSRIVSSFKGQSLVASSVVREYAGHTDGVWAVAVKAGQPIIGTASADHTAAIWAIDSGRCLLQYHGHGGSVNTLKFHATKDVVLTASGDGTAHIWQAAVKWEREAQLGGGANRAAGAGTGHSSDEELVDEDDYDDPAAGEDRDRVDVLRTPLAEFGAGAGGHSSVVIAADWLPGGEQIITASWDRTAVLWDVETREALQPLAGHDDELTYAAAHPTQRLVVTSSRDSTFRLWDFRDQIPAVSVFQGHSDAVTSTVFAARDPEKVVSGSDDRTVKVWELRNMRSALATIRTDASVNKLAVSPAGVIAMPHDNRHIRLFDLSGQRVARLPRSNRLGHQRMASSVAWAEDPSATAVNLFSAGFDRRVLGWSICLPKENQL